MFIASFLQLWTTNKTKTFKNQKSQKSHFNWLLLLDLNHDLNRLI